MRFWFDGDTRRVVLDRKISEWGGQGLLCETHADRLIVARGWELDDRRVSEPRLFSVDLADRAAAGRVRRLAQPEAHPSTPLPLDGGPLYALPSDYETPPPAPLTPMPTGKVMPTTGPAASGSDAVRDDRNDERNDRSSDRNSDSVEGRDGQVDGEADGEEEYHDDRLGEFDGSERVRSDGPSTRFQQPRRSGRNSDPRNDPADASEADPAPSAKPASVRPKRRSHTDGNTPLLTRAFDAAASRVRPSSTMASLIPQAPPLPELPNSAGRSDVWSSVRFT